MRIVIADVETTTINKGNPFSEGNVMCTIVLRTIDEISASSSHSSDSTVAFTIEYDSEPYGPKLLAIRDLLERADLLVLFNGKFDLHWIRKYIPDISFPKVWDAALAEFILSAQRAPMPSLDETLAKYGLELKRNVVKLDYWDKGIDTREIPLDILMEYNVHDVNQTYEVFKRQKLLLKGNQLKLFQLQCEDQKILEEMEFNGLLIDGELMQERAKAMQWEMEKIYLQLGQIIDSEGINWNSPQHLSAVLYGGTIKIPCRETVHRTLKSGLVKTYERNGTTVRRFDQRIQPISGTEGSATESLSDESLAFENAKRIDEGKNEIQRHWSVDEPTLRKLRATGSTKQLIQLCLTLAEYEKLVGTYYNGIPKLHSEQRWPFRTITTRDETVGESGSSALDQHGHPGTGGVEQPPTSTSSRNRKQRLVMELHGQFNQTVAVTGRLSSSGPNLQNFAGDLKECIISRYQDAD